MKMTGTLNKRLNKIEECVVMIKTKRMVICCNSDEDLNKKIAEWEAEEGVPSQSKPLVIVRTKGARHHENKNKS